MLRIGALVRYYTDAIYFCQLLNGASGSLNDILMSSVKLEVVEVMQLFVIAFAKSMEFAEVLSTRNMNSFHDRWALE